MTLLDRFDYTDHDSARRCAEPAKNATLAGDTRPEVRHPFARDRARVLHSAALRRLAGKTQVVGPGEGAEITGVPRTRLTHSLEVAQIGRGIAEELGADPDVVDTAGLAHDIGHPPFGHNGERALNEVAQACGGFEANAQTLRILVRLEPKIAGAGMNLTRASLDASCKYPWVKQPGSQKFGVYTDDLPAFAWVREGAPHRRRCLESQIMDWADDVAYSVHDVEDGILAGRIDLAALADRSERSALVGLAADHFGADRSACEDAGIRLLGLPVVAAACRLDAEELWTQAGQVVLKHLTSELVNRFASAAIHATRSASGGGPLGRYEADLAVPAPVAAEVALLKAVAVRYVMADPARLLMQAHERELLAELADAVAAGAPDTLAAPMREAWADTSDEVERWRVVLDQVAALTDQQAHSWHARLRGVSSSP
jgi:dGTPase